METFYMSASEDPSTAPTLTHAPPDDDLGNPMFEVFRYVH